MNEAFELCELERMFLGLADKTRLRLLALMADGGATVGFLAATLRESQPKVSRHLAYLRGIGMVATRRDGKRIYYSIRYPEETSRRHLLETIIRSAITVTREYIHIDNAQMMPKAQAEGQDDNIYAEPYVYELENYAPVTSPQQDVYEPKEPEELEVFLL